MDSGEILLRKEIEKYPVLEDRQQLELLDKYRNNGDEEARQKLIKHNLRLCLFVAREYTQIVKNMTFMELFDENVITLMKVIDSYNQEKGVKFSTYAIASMENNMKREINIQDDTIRKPEHINEFISKYYKLMNTYHNQYNREPTQEELKEHLQLNEKQLKNLQEALKNKKKLSSLDSIVGDGDDKSELIDFIPVNEKEFEVLNNQYDLNILKNKCIKILTPEEYYIIYYRYLSEDKLTLEKIAIEFGVTHEGIRQKEVKAKNKLKGRLQSIKENNIHYSERLDPLRIDNILILSELKQFLSKEEYFILYSIISEKQNYKNFDLLGLNPKQLKETELYLMNIFNQYREENIMENLRNKYRKKYTVAQILDLDIKMNYGNLIDFQKLDTYFQAIKWENIAETEYYINLPSHQKNLIKRYYKHNNDSLVSSQIEQVERELTLNKLGYIKKEKKLYSMNELKKLYEKYEEFLTDKQKEKLKIILFQRDKECILSQSEIEEATNVLLRKEFRIDHFFHNQITLSQMKEVMERNKDILTPREKDLIFKCYGMNTKKLSINEIASQYGESYEKIHDEIANLRERMLKKYYNIYENKKDELSEENRRLYKIYMENMQYEFSDEVRRIFSMYLNGKTYEEISNATELSRIKVSNVVMDGLRKCEFYQYGILLPILMTKEEIEKVFTKYHPSNFEKELIIERFLNLKQPKELEEKYNITVKRINGVTCKFYSEYLFFKCPEISIEEYKNELECHPSESVLSEEDKKFISLKYGIPSKYNLNGNTKTENELSKMYHIPKMSCLRRIETIENKMREKKIGFSQPKYGIIPRDDLAQLLKDENLPISDKEREILCSTNELNGYTYKTEKELAEQFKEQPASIKRRYNRAILATKKYQDKKLPKQISYDKDIKPIKKYFSEYDRNLLIMYYQKKLTYEKMRKELGLTYDQVCKKVTKLRLDVSEILKDEIIAKKFDFDYAREVLENSDLPLYYNNNKLAIKIYRMLSGEIGNKKYTSKEVIEELKLDMKDTAVTNCFYHVLLAVEKYKRGVRKQKTISSNQLICFYEKYESNLWKWKKNSFQRLLQEEAQKDSMLRSQKKISSNVVYEIIKGTEEGCVKITSIKKKDAIKILGNRKLILSSSCRRNMKNYFQIPERDLMSGKDKMKVLKLLSPLYQKVSTNKKLQKV